MSEATFRRRLIQQIKAAGGHAYAIETHQVSVGVPDINYCINGYENWVECKYTASMKKGLRLRPAQASWFKRRIKAGGEPILMAQIDLQPRSFILVKGTEVAGLVNTTSIRIWLETAYTVWENHIVWPEFIELISSAISSRA